MKLRNGPGGGEGLEKRTGGGGAQSLDTEMEPSSPSSFISGPNPLFRPKPGPSFPFSSLYPSFVHYLCSSSSSLFFAPFLDLLTSASSDSKEWQERRFEQGAIRLRIKIRG